MPSYHSLDVVDNEAGAAELPDMAEDVIVQQPHEGHQSAGSSSSVITILFQLVTRHSYIFMLIIMMVRFCHVFFACTVKPRYLAIFGPGHNFGVRRGWRLNGGSARMRPGTQEGKRLCPYTVHVCAV